MTGRTDFSRKVRAFVFDRAKGCCEKCGAKLKVSEGEVDHVIPDALGGLAVASNAELLCRVCHAEKTAKDIGRIRKADRQRDRHTGAMPKPKRRFPHSKDSPTKALIGGGWAYR